VRKPGARRTRLVRTADTLLLFGKLSVPQPGLGGSFLRVSEWFPPIRAVPVVRRCSHLTRGGLPCVERVSLYSHRAGDSP
jgi:hypothetical protein